MLVYPDGIETRASDSRATLVPAGMIDRPVNWVIDGLSSSSWMLQKRGRDLTNALRFQRYRGVPELHSWEIDIEKLFHNFSRNMFHLVY